MKRFLDVFHKVKSTSLMESFISLSFLQAAYYLLPLVAYPYLIRVIGNSGFGQIMFAYFFVQFFIIFVDFGFDFSATKMVSIHRENLQKVNEIFCSVITLKTAFSIVGVFLLTLIILIFKRFHENWPIYFLTYIMVFGKVLLPVWYFQGMERMRFLTYINVITNIIFTVAIFFLVKTKEHLYLPAILTSMGVLLGGFFGFIIALKHSKIKFYIPKREVLHSYIKDSKDMFFANVASSLYLTSTPVVLGIVTGRNDYVGDFTIAEKAVRGVRNILSPITQALYPFLSKKFNSTSFTESAKVLNRLSWYLLPFILLMVAGTIVFAPFIVKLLTGSSSQHIIINLTILSSVLAIGTYNNVWGVLGLVNLNKEKYFRNAILIGGLFNILFAIIMSYFYFDIGAGISVVCTELLIALLITYSFKRIERKSLS